MGLVVVGGFCCGVVDFGKRKKVSPLRGWLVCVGRNPGLAPPGYRLSPLLGLRRMGRPVCGWVA